MSENYVYGFRLELPALQAIRGSADEALIDRIVSTQPQTVRELSLACERVRDPRDSDPAGPVRVLLRDIVHARPDPARAWAYRECVELLCRELGTALVDRSPHGRLGTIHDFWIDDLRRVMRALGLADAAAVWAASTLAFPWDEDDARAR